MSWFVYLLIGMVVLAVLIYFGLPRLLHAMGLHPSYKIPALDLTGRRAVVITTSHDALGDTGKTTGVFGSEMTIPYYAFLDAGMEVDLASIKGGSIPVDPRSGWPLSTLEDKRFNADPEAQKKRSIRSRWAKSIRKTTTCCSWPVAGVLLTTWRSLPNWPS